MGLGVWLRRGTIRLGGRRQEQEAGAEQEPEQEPEIALAVE